jgi:hypothetical protein
MKQFEVAYTYTKTGQTKGGKFRMVVTANSWEEAEQKVLMLSDERGKYDPYYIIEI